MRVDIRRLKKFTRNEIPENFLLRKIILADKDEMQADEFLYKAEVWMKLLDAELQK